MRTPVTYLFITLCLVISLPGVIWPAYYEFFSAELPHEYWWQSVTGAFQHGFIGVRISIIVHLILNLVLLMTCGKLVEVILGTRNFLVLSLSALIGFSLTQYFSGIWINGSSGIIWAYSPFLLLPIQWSKLDQKFSPIAERSRVLLIVMWGLVTFAMGFVPLIFNPNHSLINSFIYGNLFHASATVIGFLFYIFWRKELSKPPNLSNIDNLFIRKK